MFFDHIKEMREMILAESTEDRKKALAKLLPFQRADFEGIFRAMKGFPVTIRTLDPPLHEFLPHDAKGQAEMSPRIMGVSKEMIAERVKGCTSSTRCWVSAAAGWASSIPKSPRCKPGHLRGRLHRAKGGHQGRAGDHDPAGRFPAAN